MKTGVVIVSLLLSQLSSASPAGTPDPAFSESDAPEPGNGFSFRADDELLEDLKARDLFDPEADFDRLEKVSGGVMDLRDWLIQPDGKFLMGGKSDKKIRLAAGSSYGGRRVTDFGGKEFALLRYDEDDSDPGFFPGGSSAVIGGGSEKAKTYQSSGEVRTMALQPDLKILVGGEFSFPAQAAQGNAAPFFFARLFENGALDDVFHANLARWKGQVNSPIRLFALQTDGKIIVTGEFRDIGKAPTSCLARIMPDGSLDRSFSPPSSREQPDSVAILENGGILIRHGSSTSRLRNDAVVDDISRARNGSVTWKRAGSGPAIIKAYLRIKRNGKWQFHSEMQRVRGGWQATGIVPEGEVRACGVVRMSSPPGKFYTVLSSEE